MRIHKDIIMRQSPSLNQNLFQLKKIYISEVIDDYLYGDPRPLFPLVVCFLFMLICDISILSLKLDEEYYRVVFYIK
jgi:hypothetical protein